MAEAQVEQLVKMAHHIARNMAAEGDAAAGNAAEHIRKFWTPAMRQLLVDYSRQPDAELPTPVQQVVEQLSNS